MDDARRCTYRVTIRHDPRVHRYEIPEFQARDLPQALAKATSRFFEALVESADLVEVRLANPAERQVV